MIIGTLSGEAGAGKSLQAMQFEEDIVILDMENRLEEKRKRYFPEKLITVEQLMKYDNEYNEDQVSSFNAFVSEVKSILRSEPPRTIVVDGIGELRTYATAKWLKDTGRKQAFTLGDFAQINDLVRDTLFPLINFGRIKDVNILFTSQMKDEYMVIDQEGKKVSARAGRTHAHKEWVSYNVDLLVDLWQPLNKDKHPDGRYMATVTKSPVGCFEEDITGKSLFEVLKRRGL